MEFEKLLEKVFEESVEIFFKKDIQNILDDVAERNLCGRLAIYLTEKLREYKIVGYYADPEYNRKQGGQVKTILDDKFEEIKIQCDLIVHSRGENIRQDNLIAIEMKKVDRPELEKKNDRKRLRAMTKESFDDIWSNDGITHPEHVCGYIIGVYMIIDSSSRTCYFEYYKKGKKIGEELQNF